MSAWRAAHSPRPAGPATSGSISRKARERAAAGTGLRAREGIASMRCVPGPTGTSCRCRVGATRGTATAPGRWAPSESSGCKSRSRAPPRALFPFHHSAPRTGAHLFVAEFLAGLGCLRPRPPLLGLRWPPRRRSSSISPIGGGDRRSLLPLLATPRKFGSYLNFIVVIH
ncbi:hypothetical protein U9M48_007408 [Paspalum notatum var. saurae]|uniref:Uncharacterized protein n=1 Tax=Paspalum notatum var. saurae TaxID=547442 RepID=A0AAQ3SH08_PASNO